MTDDARFDIRDDFAHLQQIPIFHKLQKSTLESIYLQGNTLQIKRGAYIFLEGTAADSVHILLHGHVKIVRQTEDGQEIILRMILSGEMFGGAGAWGEKIYPATAIALTDSLAFRIAAQTFMHLLTSHPDLAMTMMQEIARRLREAENRISELQVERVERRIARTLLRLASKSGTRTDEGVEISIPLSRQHLAELAGATLSTVSRVLSGWDRRGIILARREKIVIVQPHGLVSIAEDLEVLE